MGNNRDSAGIAACIRKGGKYLIVNGNEILSRTYIQSFLNHQVGQYGNIRIYKPDRLHPETKSNDNSIIKKNEVVICGAETLVQNGKYFKADSSDVLLESGNCQSVEKFYSGKYSACLTPEKAFAMTYRFKNVAPGEHYTITVFRLSEQGNGLLVASANNSNEFYLNKPNNIEKLSNGWEKLTLDFYVNFKPSDGELAVYLWNEGKTPVYFDDLNILRKYESDK